MNPSNIFLPVFIAIFLLATAVLSALFPSWYWTDGAVTVDGHRYPVKCDGKSSSMTFEEAGFTYTCGGNPTVHKVVYIKR